MKEMRNTKRRDLETPIWCDHCRVRIAPYEQIVTAETKAFHVHCFQKEEAAARSQNDLIGGSGLTLAMA